MLIDDFTLDALYRELRPHAFTVAYQMLGTVSDAEDVVQDAFVRLQRAPGLEIASPKAYLTAVTARLALDRLRSARARRETYPGPWLPEPLVEPEQGLPALSGSRALSMAFLVLLEVLAPVERAVFVLRDVFELEYAQIAQIVDKTADNCRQIAARARRRIEANQSRSMPLVQGRDVLAQRFFEAFEAGDTDALLALLTTDVAFHGDGGGKARGFPRPIRGRDNVARLLTGMSPLLRSLCARLERASVNHEPGAVFRDAHDRLINVWSVEMVEGARVRAIRSIINPDKLRHLAPLSELALRS